MDQFGVQKPELKKIAKTPALPGLQAAVAETTPAKPRKTAYWLQASVKVLVGEEFSAFGVSRDAGGLQLLAIPAGSAAARAGLQKDDLLMTVNGRALKQLGDLAQAMNDADGNPLDVEFVRNQKRQKVQIAAYPVVAAEDSDNGTFKLIPLADAAACLPIQAITSMPGTNNEPLATLRDGKLAANYGPVFSNNTAVGLYKIDLGTTQELLEINTWSCSEGARGPQNLVLYGSATDTDPGWSIDNGEIFTLIAEVNTQGRTIAKFNATSVRHSQGMSLGSFRWLIFATYPLNSTGEHTAFQELQVRTFQSR